MAGVSFRCMKLRSYDAKDPDFSFLPLPVILFLLFLSVMVATIRRMGIPAKRNVCEIKNGIFSNENESPKNMFFFCKRLERIKYSKKHFSSWEQICWESHTVRAEQVVSYLSFLFFFFFLSLSWLRSRLRRRLLCDWCDSEDFDLLLSGQRLNAQNHIMYLKQRPFWFTRLLKQTLSFFFFTLEENDQIWRPASHPLPLSTAWPAPLNGHWSPLWSPAGSSPRCKLSVSTFF